MENSSSESMCNATTCTNPSHMITFKELEQQLIERVTISVLRNDTDDRTSLDSGFQDFNNVTL